MTQENWVYCSTIPARSGIADLSMVSRRHVFCTVLLTLLDIRFFSSESDSTTNNVHQRCGYIKSRMWLYTKRCGYIAQNPTSFWIKPHLCYKPHLFEDDISAIPTSLIPTSLNQSLSSLGPGPSPISISNVKTQKRTRADVKIQIHHPPTP